ncbi:class I SAM-dependent methyltransferase [Chitinophaga sp. GCM10012297]|uniref:Class I SAM-dependent methyltransferase n=1 Tax=Chitinophaga chungangae TaxID=2821488 RepID=A0ABS3Y7Z9_9BACT|nr:class I SAM-dependent methyltransferase [Chitinophaga chungangae]MBO9150796.1 class I SAM-dependent methyltransferase [Chitinophaga chungangae]
MDNTQRFNHRVESYAAYRPDYPAEMVGFLQGKYNLGPGKPIADVGAGTGISTALFLKAGYAVFAVEPNTPMLEKATEMLGKYPGFHAVNGSAENTTLGSESVDAVIAAQAFHWFNPQQSKNEFLRILRPGGIVALIWNERRVHSDFEKDYEALINRHGKDYIKVRHRNIDMEHIAAFFSPHAVELNTFTNAQVFGLEGLKGRLSSSSYMPLSTEAGYAEMMEDLEKLFARFSENGRITISYETKVYSGIFK